MAVKVFNSPRKLSQGIEHAGTSIELPWSNHKGNQLSKQGTYLWPISSALLKSQ
jgi:hypothetical protein